MPGAASTRAQDDLTHFRTQLTRLLPLLQEHDDYMSGHEAYIRTLLADAEQALKRQKYRRVGPNLRHARTHLQYVTGQLVEAIPANQFSWWTWCRDHALRWSRRHCPAKLVVAFCVALALPVCVHLEAAITVHNARNAVTAALDGTGYATTSQVLTAAGLSSGYYFYAGPWSQPIQNLRPGQMAWIDSSNIEGAPGQYGIVPANQGTGSMSVSNGVENITSQGSSSGVVQGPSSQDTGLAVLVARTSAGFIGVAFQSKCPGYGETTPSSGFSGRGFTPGDIPIQIITIPLACPSDT
jgi:hypothetical protein